MKKYMKSRRLTRRERPGRKSHPPLKRKRSKHRPLKRRWRKTRSYRVKGNQNPWKWRLNRPRPRNNHLQRTNSDQAIFIHKIKVISAYLMKVQNNFKVLLKEK